MTQVGREDVFTKIIKQELLVYAARRREENSKRGLCPVKSHHTLSWGGYRGPLTRESQLLCAKARGLASCQQV